MHAQNDASSVYVVQDGTGGPPSPITPDELTPEEVAPEELPPGTPEDEPPVAPDEPPLEDCPPDDPPEEPEPPLDEPPGAPDWTAPEQAAMHPPSATKRAILRALAPFALFDRRPMCPLPLIGV
jgi:hypothetical protein